MPPRRHSPEWRTLPAEVVAPVSAALDRFVVTAGRTRRELARALDLDPSDLAPSHLQGRALLLWWGLRRAALPHLALRLRLDLDGYRALEALSGTVTTLVGGYEIAEASWRNSRREALDAGEIGVELFDRHDWPAAVSHLSFAWDAFSAGPPAPGDGGYVISLRVGAQLANWLCYQGQVRPAVDAARRLLRLAGSYRGGEAPVLGALGLAYKTVAVTAHHQPLAHPRQVIRLGERGHAVLAGHGLDRPAQAAILRDQAKPYVQWALEEGSGAPDPGLAARALGVLDRAELLAGGEQPEEGAAAEWLFTRLTRVECLALTGQGEDARRCWEETLEPDEVRRLLRDHPEGPLAVKVAFTRIAVVLAAGDLDGVAGAAQTFLQDPTSGSYIDRLRRAGEIEAGAAHGDLQAARRAFLR